MPNSVAPLWILCNPRTGSSLLCEHLNNTGVFEPYENNKLLGSVGNLGPTERGRAFGEWLRITDEDSMPCFLKCIHHQYISTYNLTAQEVKHKLNGIKFVLLKRRNLAQHAASVYFARKTDCYHIWGIDKLRTYLQEPVEIDIDELKHIMLEVLEYQTNWDEFCKGEECLEIYFEDILHSPVQVLRKIFDFIGFMISDTDLADAISHNRLLQQTRPESDEVARLITKHSCILM